LYPPLSTKRAVIAAYRVVLMPSKIQDFSVTSVAIT